MRAKIWIAIGSLIAASAPLLAFPLPEPAPREHWECVPFARAVSGIQIYGDAWTWWDQADGKYKRGQTPRVGAVMAFEPHGRMELGHVATVSGIIDARTITVTHANWSPIDGRRGQIERNVEVQDVSQDGDWSAVRVWFAPSQALGTTAWPVHGFIYGTQAQAAPKPITPTLERYDPRPSGRLNYLPKMLAKMKQTTP
jgi:surface antigen